MSEEPTPAPPTRSARSRRWVVLPILFPVAVQAAIVAICAEAMLAWDEFHYAALMRAIGEGRPWLHWILAQHNEHRIVWTKLVLLAHAPLSSWNPVVEMYVSALLLGPIAFGIWKLYRRAGGESPLYFWPVALLLCNTAQFMNMLYGIMTCHYFTMAGMVWSLVFLTRGTWPALAAAVGAAAVAMWSTLNGIVIWPAGLAVLWLERRPRAHQVAWAIAAAALTGAYFVDFQNPGKHAPLVWSLGTLRDIVAAVVVSLGSPLSGQSLPLAIALGIATLILIVVASAGARALGRQAEHAGLIGLTLLALGSAAAIGYGRYRLGLAGVLESKYVTYMTLGVIGPYLGLVCQRAHPRRSSWLAVSLAMIGVGLILANEFGVSKIPEWTKGRRMHRYLVQTIERQPDESLGAVYKLDQIRDISAYLRAARLGPFRQPVDALLVMRWREAMATAAIVPGSEVWTRLLCPVDTLRDFAVIVGPASAVPAGGPGGLQITLHANGRMVAGRVLYMRDVSHHDDWVRVSLPEPIRGCRARPIEVRVETDGALPDAGVRALTFPVYYGGITRQGPVVIRNRDLGIAFNGVAARLLP